MLTNFRRIDKNGLLPGRGFVINSPLPEQQDYKCRTKFNAQGLGGMGTLGIYRGMVIKLSLNNYLKFDGCRIAQGSYKLKFISCHFRTLF